MCQLSDKVSARSAFVSEPFRFFFPLGMALGLIGVLLWPLFAIGWIEVYPLIAHTRLMIMGFVTCFIVGFLFTAGPRLLSAPTARPRSLAALALGLVSMAVAHLGYRPLLGDLLFVAVMTVLLLEVARLLRQRQDIPPPGFVLTALGLACGLCGALFQLLSVTPWATAWGHIAGNALLYQGFTLLPIVGVGPFFFPKILGIASRHDYPSTLRPTPDWWKRFNRAALVGILFLASVVLESLHHVSAAYALRFGALGVYLLMEIGFVAASLRQSPHAPHLVVALLSVALGFVGVVLFPEARVAWLHAYFIVGLTGIILLVSVRVVFGHSGRPELIRKSAKAFVSIFGLLLLAAATRIFADYNMAHRISHYAYAALLWLACGGYWLFFVAPKTRPSSSLATDAG